LPYCWRSWCGLDKAPVSFPNITSLIPLEGRVFNIKKSGHQWVWFERDSTHALVHYSEVTGIQKNLIMTKVSHFDLLNDKLIFGTRNQTSSDIYQTQSVNKSRK